MQQMMTGTLNFLRHFVHLHRNLNQKQYIFVLRIAPTTAVKLFDSISLSRIGEGQFSVQTWGSFGCN